MQTCSNCNLIIEKDKYDTHAGYCFRNIIKCSKCQRPIDKKEIEEHENQFHSLTSCKYCQNKFNKEDLVAHTQNCAAKKVTCQYCSLMFPLEQVEEHIAHCGSRTQLCELCEKYIKDKDYNEHVMHCEGKVYESELQDAPSEQYQGSQILDHNEMNPPQLFSNFFGGFGTGQTNITTMAYNLVNNGVVRHSLSVTTSSRNAQPPVTTRTETFNYVPYGEYRRQPQAHVNREDEDEDVQAAIIASMELQ